MGLKELSKKVKQGENDRTVEQRFVSALDKYIVTSRAERAQERPRRLAFNPSSYYKCQRQQWYKLMGVKEQKQYRARSERILEVGTALHEWVQTKVLMEMDEKEDSQIHLIPKEETPVYGRDDFTFIEEHSAPPTEVKFLDTRFTKKIPISAMVDGIFHFEGLDMIFEFKTINPTSFSTLVEPSIDYVKQGAMYSLCLELPRVLFLFLCKGTQQWRSFIVEYTQEQREWVILRIQAIENYVLTEELPPKEESKQCNWCGFKGLCDKNKKS